MRTGPRLRVSCVVARVIDHFSRLRTRGMKGQPTEILRRDWDNIITLPTVGNLPVTEEAKDVYRMVFEPLIPMHLGAFAVRPMAPMVIGSRIEETRAQ